MTMEEFLALANPERYDFSNDGANAAYQQIKDPEEKFFVYMAIKRAYKRTDPSIMKKGADFSQGCIKTYGHILDPDSGSELLRKIYHKLWNEDKLRHCRKADGTIQGETVSSANTTLNFGYERFIESVQEREERKKLKQNVSIRYILSRYTEARSADKKLFKDHPEIGTFLSVYHTLGNFMTVPVDCNSPRGRGITKDYWDLALRIIYDYYAGKRDAIGDIVGDDDNLISRYKEWLASFGSWDAFVEDNYLQDFVNYCYCTSKYAMPKELWKNHFSSCSVLPQTADDVEQFYTNASSWILARGNRMFIALKKKVRDEKQHN